MFIRRQGDPFGPLVNDVFFIASPTLDGLDTVDKGTIQAQTDASAAFLIVPRRDAAPGRDIVVYDVSGKLTYADQGLDGVLVEVDLFPDAIEVAPDPLLKVCPLNCGRCVLLTRAVSRCGITGSIVCSRMIPSPWRSSRLSPSISPWWWKTRVSSSVRSSSDHNHFACRQRLCEQLPSDVESGIRFLHSETLLTRLLTTARNCGQRQGSLRPVSHHW